MNGLSIVDMAWLRINAYVHAWCVGSRRTGLYHVDGISCFYGVYIYKYVIIMSDIYSVYVSPYRVLRTSTLIEMRLIVLPRCGDERDEAPMCQWLLWEQVPYRYMYMGST